MKISREESVFTLAKFSRPEQFCVMPTEVDARYRWTADELLAGMRSHYRVQFPRFVRLLYFIVAGMAFVTGLIGAFQVGVAKSFFSLAIGTLLLLQFTVIQPLVLKAQFRKRPDKDAELTWRFTPEQASNSGFGGRSEFRWDALAKVVQVRDGLLFYPTNQVFNWVPNHAFQSEADLVQVVEWAQQHARVFRKNIPC